nr:MAG TPA: Single strand binding protein [Caudoviricetes sp.]
MLNLVQIIGHLGRDPEMRYTAAGDAVCTVSVATTEKWTSKTGEKQERTEWHRVVAFGKLAEIFGQYLRQGSRVYVSGKLATRKYAGQDGQDRYVTEIRAAEMRMLDRAHGAPDEREFQNSAAPAGARFSPADDDIPF